MSEKELLSDEVLTQEETPDETEKVCKDVSVCCDPCLQDGENINAEGFCVNCNDYLCCVCYTSHKKSRASRNHVLKDKIDMPASKPAELNEIEICSEHKFEIITHYCQSHDQALCKLCKQLDHRNCINVHALTDIFIGSENSKVLQEMTFQLGSLQAEFAFNMNVSIENKTDIEKNHLKVIKDLEMIRDKDLEMMSSIENTCKAVNLQIATLRHHLESCRHDKRLSFLAMLKSKAETNILRERLASAKADINISRYRFVQTNMSADISSSVIGVIRKCPSKLEEINLSTSSDNFVGSITGIDRLSDNRLVVADHKNSKIKLIDMTSKTVISEVKLDTFPWDLTKIDHNKVAVTTYDMKKILILSLSDDTLTVQKSINKNEFSQCRSIICSNDTLTVSFKDPDQLQVLDFDGIVMQTIDNKSQDGTARFGSYIYVAQHPSTNALFLSDCDNNKILSIALDGKIKATFVHEYLKKPRGLTVGVNDRIFVCSYGCNNIFELSFDLSEGNILFDETDGISGPHSIMIDKEDRLFVGCMNKNLIQVFFP